MSSGVPVEDGVSAGGLPRRRGSYEIRVRCEDLDELTATVTRLAGGGDDS